MWSVIDKSSVNKNNNGFYISAYSKCSAAHLKFFHTPEMQVNADFQKGPKGYFISKFFKAIWTANSRRFISTLRYHSNFSCSEAVQRLGNEFSLLCIGFPAKNLALSYFGIVSVKRIEFSSFAYTNGCKSEKQLFHVTTRSSSAHVFHQQFC